MRICLCMPSRGRPDSLWKAIETTDANAFDPGRVTFSVALDDDDETITVPPRTRSHVVWDIAEREDTLGAKYNRAWGNVDADIYIQHCDDQHILEPGWDRILDRFMETVERPGLFYFGTYEADLGSHICMTQEMTGILGQFMPPYFPNWWHDVWVDEVAMLSRRHASLTGVASETFGNRACIGVRDVTFWQAHYDRLEPKRLEEAGKLLDAWYPEEAEKIKAELWPQILSVTRHRGALLRDPIKAAQFEKSMSVDAPNDDRYMRIKGWAESLTDLGEAPYERPRLIAGCGARD